MLLLQRLTTAWWVPLAGGGVHKPKNWLGEKSNGNASVKRGKAVSNAGDKPKEESTAAISEEASRNTKRVTKKVHK